VNAELSKTQRSLGAVQWILSLLVVAAIAAVVLVRNGTIDPKQVFNQPELASKVQSKGYDFINRNGKRVLLVEDDKFGYPDLIFLDNTLNYRMGITMAPDADGGAPEIALYDSTGTRAQFRTGRENEAFVRLLGQHEKGGILMSVSRDGKPSLTLTDNTGKVLFHVPEGTKPPEDSSQRSEGRR
jgi:hypothetical protein